MGHKRLKEWLGDRDDWNVENWHQVNVPSLKPEDKEIFLNRKKAIDYYINSERTLSEIQNETGIEKAALYRLLKRCLYKDMYNENFGYRGLIPHLKIKEYERKDLPVGLHANATGAFTLFLDRYPEIKKMIDDKFFGKTKNVLMDRHIAIKNLHNQMVQACKKAGIKGNEYPFTSKDSAKRSLERYLKKLADFHFSSGASRYGEEARTAAVNTGMNHKNNHSLRPFQRVQLDGHRIDVLMTLKYLTPDGREVVDKIDRLWVLAIIDEDTRVILGYHVCIKKEYNADDVIYCLQNAVKPKEPVTFSISGLTYNETAGFPTWKSHGCEWVLWEEILLDNAKSHLSQKVTDCLHDNIRCSINLGPVSQPQRRPHIEQFFRILEENGFHRLPNTTGSNPKDPKRKNPEKFAMKYEINEKELTELVEVWLANYNGTPKSALYGLTPLEALQQRVEQGVILRKLPYEKRNDTAFFVIITERRVRGDIKKGRRPHIFFQGAYYRSDKLGSSGAFIGKTLTLHVNTEDIRTLRAFLPNGAELGILEVTGHWRYQKHSLVLRKKIMGMIKSKLIQCSDSDDVLAAYEKHLINKAMDSKSTRTELANLKRNQEIEPEFPPPVTEVEDKTRVEPEIQAEPIKPMIKKTFIL
ncbi:hypothetical protein [Metabacillus hrfriensis]|uniref:Uncharacterized protein n=1 Tax=Metabacillus hrfriensis TaxID=3048891 RepID=A0ACD4RIR5_9BACI|nr:hypothetical protein [Metabacillus sp. CT-WN-B3]WHZ60077.1 hypothetical protein QLQ22_12410 [Metabacillus sp. CT-WN-B3]